MPKLRGSTQILDRSVTDALLYLPQTYLIVSAGRNNDSVTNQYLRGPDGTPTNLAPMILPFGAILTAISASCYIPGTWTAEVHVGGSLFDPLSKLDIVAATYESVNGLNIVFPLESGVQIYLNGTGIEFPRVDLIFRRQSWT